MQPYCSCHNRNVLCCDTKFVAISSFYTHAFGNCRDKHFSFQLVYSIATEFLWFLHNLCHNKILFCGDKISFLVLVAS